MKKHILFFLLLASSPILLFAQQAYYKTDTTTFNGVKITDGGAINNAKYFQVIINNKLEKLFPDEVREYGTKKGTTYFTKSIQLNDSLQKVFLERITSGKTKLYYFKDEKIETYFLEKDSNLLISLPKKNVDGKSFREILYDYTADCEHVSDASKLVLYNRNSLKRFVNQYNDCRSQAFPYFKYGILSGYEISHLIVPSGSTVIYLNMFNELPNSGNLMAGLFIDLPILASDYSLHTEVYYSSHSISTNQKNENTELDFIASTSAIKIPVLVRYTYPSSKIRPFFNTGAVFSKYLKSDSKLLETITTNNIINIKKANGFYPFSKSQFGYAAGLGIEIPVRYKNSFFFELRLNQLYGEANTLKNTDLQFITSFNF